MNLTLDDLLLRFGAREIAELSDHTGRSDVNHDVVNKAIEDAEALARSYYNAAGLYKVPFDAATVGRMADIAVYRLSEEVPTDTRERRYKEAIAWFEMLVRHPGMVQAGGGNDARVGRARLVRG